MLSNREHKGRFVVYAGDEITFICNARYAFDIVKTYISSLPEKGNGTDTSCAGVAIFKSHAPYSEAYRIAEECCENAKKLMKKTNTTDACLMDFEYLQGAIGVSLEHIREHEKTAEFCLPWLLSEGTINGAETIGDVELIGKVLNIIARTNSKTLLTKSKESESAYKMEIERIISHFKGDDADKKVLVDNKEMILKKSVLVYRMMLVYDLWFRNSSSGTKEDTE